MAQGPCNGRRPGQQPPRKGRPAALAVSPFPAKPREGGSRAAAQGVVHVYRPRIILEMMFFWISLEPPKIDSLR